VKEIATDFNTAHKQNVSPTPLITRLYNKPKLITYKQLQMMQQPQQLVQQQLVQQQQQQRQ
jgi:hypothetical protein